MIDLMIPHLDFIYLQLELAEKWKVALCWRADSL